MSLVDEMFKDVIDTFETEKGCNEFLDGCLMLGFVFDDINCFSLSFKEKRNLCENLWRYLCNEAENEMRMH